MMDREKAVVPQIQLEFTDNVAMKVFNCISKLLPELSITYETLKLNRACWEALNAILEEEGVTSSNGLDYLRNDNVESKVYARVKHEGKYDEHLLSSGKMSPTPK